MNNLLRGVVLAALSLVFLMPATAAADEGERDFYVVVKGGPYFPTATNAFTALGESFKWPAAYTIEGGVGAYWGLLGLQLSAGYLTSGTTSTTGTVTAQTGVNAVPILLLARIRLPLGFIAPYAEGGAGVAIATSSFENLSSTQAGFEAVGGGGVDLYFGPLLVGAELRFMWLNPSFNFSGVNNVGSFTQSLNLSGITVEAYVGYRF
ncbi:MAG: outer membrane beta-barrel protein [Myxococcaceae bacterium]